MASPASAPKRFKAAILLSPRLGRRLEIAAYVFFIAIATAMVFTKLPFVDEGTFGGSAINILRTGHTGNPSTPPWGLGIPLVDSQRYNFWVMPAYLYLLAGWFRIGSQTLFWARMLSVAFGAALLTIFYRFIRLLSESKGVAALACSLLAVDFNLALRASTARMDTMSVFLNFAAWVAYLGLRGRNFFAAIAASCFLGGLGILTHPNGALAFVGIAVLVWMFDWRRLRLSSLLACAAGVALPAAAQALVILQAPAVWRAQMASHAQGRFDAFVHPLAALRDEFLQRYYWSWGGIGFGSPLGTHFPAERAVLLLVLAAYAAACIFLWTRALRDRPVAKVARWILLITIVYFTWFETGKLVVYNIQVIPWFCLALALMASELWKRREWRLPLAAGVGLVVFINMASSLAYAANDRYGNHYKPVAALLRANMGPQDLAVTHAFFGFDLGFDRVAEDYTLVDVVRRKPEFVILDNWFTLKGDTKTYKFGPDPIAAGMITQQEKTEAVRLIQTDYRLVLKNSDFIVFQKIKPF